MRIRTRKLALAEGVTAGVLFGTAAILIRLLPDLDAFSIGFWRLIIACLALSAILLVLRRSFSFDLMRKNVKDLAFLSVFLGLHFLFFISAVKDTTILNATVLVNTSPLFSVVVSTFLFKLKPSRMAIWGLALSFIGVCVIAFAEATTANTQATGVSPSLKGDVEAVLAAVVEAFYLNFGRKTRSQMHILTIMLPVYAFSALVVGALSIPAKATILTIPVQIEALLPLLGLGLLSTAIAHTLYFSSLSNLKSFETATMALLEPIGATILGIAIFQEVPVLLFGLGAFMILIGVLFISLNKS